MADAAAVCSVTELDCVVQSAAKLAAMTLLLLGCAGAAAAVNEEDHWSGGIKDSGDGGGRQQGGVVPNWIHAVVLDHATIGQIMDGMLHCCRLDIPLEIWALARLVRCLPGMG